MEHLKKISERPQMRPFGLIFYEKVHESVFEHLVLNCTINREVCKRTCLIGAFMQHLTHFWLAFSGLFFRLGVPNYTLWHYFL